VPAVAPPRYSPPRPAPLPPDVDAWPRPAGTFSGDLYFFDHRGDDLVFYLGDVAGKGLDAAILMAMLHETLETETARELLSVDPGRLADHLSTTLRDELPANRFVTLTAGRLGADGGLRIVNAGHCPPVLLRASGAIELLPPTGPILGPIEAARWTTQVRRLEAGDALVLVSDGIVEAESAASEEFGVDGLVAALRSGGPSSAHGLADRVLRSVERFRGDGEASDDTSVLAIRMEDGRRLRRIDVDAS